MEVNKAGSPTKEFADGLCQENPAGLAVGARVNGSGKGQPKWHIHPRKSRRSRLRAKKRMRGRRRKRERKDGLKETQGEEESMKVEGGKRRRGRRFAGRGGAGQGRAVVLQIPEDSHVGLSAAQRGELVL
jgi:hypothetical protein